MVAENASVAGTLSHIRDLSESTLEHQTLHAGLVQSNLPDSILGKSQL